MRDNKLKITFGICTYNRKDILLKMASSLKQIEDFNSINIRIYDDCSTEYDLEFLRKVFPDAKTIIRHDKNLGADKNTAYMYNDFINYDDEWFFNADSDLIYRKDILSFISDCIDNSLQFFSLFNTLNHKAVGSANDFFVKKNYVGAAGCCFNKNLIKTIIREVNDAHINFDFKFCDYLRNNGYDIIVSKESYVQHIGVDGYNSTNIFFDYGQNFKCDSMVNGIIIEETFERYMTLVNTFKNSYKWKIYYSVGSLPKRIYLNLYRKFRLK